MLLTLVGCLTPLRVDLGTCYLYGRGVKQDYAQAAYWLNKAAEAGHSAGLHRLGVLYWNGWGVPRDEPESVKLWIKVHCHALCALHTISSAFVID